MSLSGIASSNLFNYGDQNLQNNLQPLPQEFQQLGQDLQSGNLSGAQSSNPIVQAFHQPGQDLQSGNVSAARRDYSNVKRDYQNAAHTRIRQYHAIRSGDGELSQLGQALQSSSVSSAQTAYNSLLHSPSASK